MSFHGFDPGDRNNWYQSPQLGLFPVSPAGYGGGISGACYLTHSSHPHGSPSYPPPPSFPLQPSYPPPPPFPFQPNYSPPPPPPSQTMINGYVFPHQFPCISQTHAQFSPPPQLQPIYPIAQQPLTTTPQSPSIPHSNPNPWIYTPISQSHSCDPHSQFVSTKPMTTTPIHHSAPSPPVCEKPHSPPQGSSKLQAHKQHTEAKLCEMRESLKSSMDTFISEFREELRLLRGSLRSPTRQVDNPLKFCSPPPSSTPQLIPAATEASASLIHADNGIIRKTPVDNDLNLFHTDVILGFNDNTSMDNIVGFVCGTKLNGIDEKLDTGDGENSDEMVKVNSGDGREFNELKGVTPGTNPYSIKKGIGKTVQAVINELENKSRLVKGCNDLTIVTSMSAGNDKQLGRMIVTAIDKAGQKPKEKPDFSVPLIKDESILVESTKLLVPGALDWTTILHSNSNGSYHESDSGYQLHSPTSCETKSSKCRDFTLDGLWDDSSGLPTMKTKFKSFCKPGDDGRLRNYGLVDAVVSISPFEVEISWLDLQNNGDQWVASWENMGLHVPCEKSKVTQQSTTNLVYIISHVVDCDRAAGEIYLIYPKKEFVWALYKEATFDAEGRNLLGVKEKRCYEIVVFLTSYSEMHSLSMGYLDLISAIKKFLSDTIEPWLDGTFSENGFLHDNKWGGIVTKKGLADLGADYNDHHYHLGYFIYVIPVISKIDLARGKKYMSQAYSLDQKPNFQQESSYFGIVPVILKEVFSFSSEMHCFSLVTIIFNAGIAPTVQPFSRDWGFQVHQLWPPLMMMRCFSLPLSLLGNDYFKSTLLITDVTGGNPYLFDVVVLHFLCQTQASCHPRSLIVDEFFDFLKSNSKLSFVRYTCDALLLSDNCVGFLTNMHKFFQHMVGHVHKDEFFMATCSFTSCPPFHALVKKLFLLSYVVAIHSIRPLLADILRDDAQFIFGIMMVVSMNELMFLRSKKQDLQIGYSDIDNGNYCSSMSCSLHLPYFMITWFFEFTSVAIDFGDLALIPPQYFSVPMRTNEAPSLILLFRVVHSQAIEFVNSSLILQGPNREALRTSATSHVGVHLCALLHTWQVTNDENEATAVAFALNSVAAVYFQLSSRKAAFDTDIYVASALIDMYSKSGLSLNFQEKEAFTYLTKMRQYEMFPTPFSYATLLSCCAKLASSFQEKQITTLTLMKISLAKVFEIESDGGLAHNLEKMCLLIAGHEWAADVISSDVPLPNVDDLADQLVEVLDLFGIILTTPTYQLSTPFVTDEWLVEADMIIKARQEKRMVFAEVLAQFPFLTCLRPEGRPYFKGGGLLGLLFYNYILSWANVLSYLSGLCFQLGLSMYIADWTRVGSSGKLVCLGMFADRAI